MTLREKLAEVNPDLVGERFTRGVSGCPYNYDFLHVDDLLCEVTEYHPASILDVCRECWNREYVPAETVDHPEHYQKMELNKWLEHARLLVRVVEKDTCVHAEIEYEDLVQELAWFEELQAYRDTGLTPEQVNELEATLWKEQGLIARESDRERERGRWIPLDKDPWIHECKCSKCGARTLVRLWESAGKGTKFCPNCGAKMDETC